MHRKYLMPLFVAFAFFYILTVPQIQARKLVQDDPRKVTWHISALSVTFDKQRELYIAEDQVVITGGKTRLEADYVEFSNKTKQAFAQGNVLLISGEDSISCNAMEINLATEVGTISKGTIFIQKNNFYIHGENIRKTGKFTYKADRGSITSCTGDTPDWKISARNIDVTIEGYGTASHTILWAKNVPALYSPYLIFPVQAKRQSGFLIPQVGTSDRLGIEYEQPLFLATSRNTDVTLYADYMSDRGVKGAAEFRYVLDNRSQGAIFLDYLKDSKIDDGSENTKQYAYASTPARTNEHRFWFRMKHSQELDSGFNVKLDLDIVSDQDYLSEFNDGFTGYTQTNEYFEKFHHRSLDAADDYTRKNWLNLYKSWSNFIFNVDVLWYDNVNARKQDTPDTTLQTLPGIEFLASKQEIGSSIYYSLDSEYRVFYRQDTTATLVNGQRLDLNPKFYRPFKIGKVFNFEPYIGLRETVWHTSDFVDTNGNSDDFRTRETYETGAELSTKLIRIFNPENRFADRIKHEFIPKLEYVYSPHIGQDDLPYFDEIDRLDEQNLLTWSLTNVLISRKTRTAPRSGETSVYKEFAYIKLYQSYDIKKERDNESRPFSPFYLELELNPFSYLSLDMDTSWSPYDSHFKSLNVASTITDFRNDQLTTEYRYTIDEAESIYSRLDIRLTKSISAFTSIERNLALDKTVETKAGFTVERACWTLNLVFSESRGDNAVTFLINLHGLGEFGI